MSFSNFLVHGSNYDKNYYNEKTLSHPEVTAVNPTHTFDGSITAISDTEKMIDGAISVKLRITDTERAAQLSMWRGLAIKSGVLSFTAAVLAAGGAAAVILLFSPTVPVVIVSVAITIAGFALSIFALKRVNDALEEQKTWKDPLPQLVEKRKALGRAGGVAYANCHSLKNTLIHPDELKKRWWDESLERTNQAKIKTASLKLFFTPNNPMEHIDYVFPVDERNTVKAIKMNKYDTIKTYYELIINDADKKSENINNKRKEQLANNENKKNAILLPMRLIYDESLKNAQNTYERAISSALTKKTQALKNAREITEPTKRQKAITNAEDDFKTDPCVIEAARTKSNAEKSASSILKVAQLPVTTFFDNCALTINKHADELLSKVKDRESYALETLKPAIEAMAEDLTAKQPSEPIRIDLQEQSLNEPVLPNYEDVIFSDTMQAIGAAIT